MYQAYKARRWLDIIVIAAVYILTAILASLLYASRLYTNRGIIREIPKTFMPVEKDDLPGKRLRHLIEGRLIKSATTAYLAKPRSTRPELDSASIRDRMSKLTKSDLFKLGGLHEPTWGAVAHRGWTSPTGSDLPPSLHFEAVIKELPDLVEAKAVSLATTESRTPTGTSAAGMPAEVIIEVLQRPLGTGMREYFHQLQALGVLKDQDVGSDFLVAYERARYGPEPPTEDEFRAVMNLFAEILRAISPLNPRHLLELRSVDEDDSSSHSMTPYEISSDASTVDKKGSVRHDPSSRPQSIAESYSGDDEDNISTPGARRSVSHSPPRPMMGLRMTSNNSGRSLRQTTSNLSKASKGSSRSQSSVIRLTNHTDRSALPYSFSTPRLETT